MRSRIVIGALLRFLRAIQPRWNLGALAPARHTAFINKGGTMRLSEVSTRGLVAAGLFLGSMLSGATADDGVAGEIAAQIRAQGQPCNTAETATRDAAQLRPDEAVWTVKCENATYRVRLIPDMAAKIERVD